MTVESNHVIALVLGPSFSCFSHCLQKKVGSTSPQIRNKQGIGLGLSSTSSWLVKASIALVQGCVMPSCFQSN